MKGILLLSFAAFLVGSPSHLWAQADTQSVFLAVFQEVERRFPDEVYGVVMDATIQMEDHLTRLRVDRAQNEAFADARGFPIGRAEEMVVCPNPGTARGCFIKGSVSAVVSFLLDTDEVDQKAVFVLLRREQEIERIPIYSALYRATVRELGGTWVVAEFEEIWVS